MVKKILSTTALLITLGVSSLALAQTPPEGGAGGYGRGGFGLNKALSALPADKADAFRATLKQGHEKTAAVREQIKALHEQLYTIMTAPKFDKSAYLAKSKELRGLNEKMQKSHNEAFANALSALSPDERKTLADTLRDMHKKHEHGGEEKPADNAQ